MRVLITAVLLFQLQALVAQVTASSTSHNFGDIYSDSQSYVDIQFTNKTANPQFLLTIDKPRDVYYVFSGKKMLPDSSIIIRFKINDAIKGKFSYQVDLYFSDSNTSMPIYLTGNVKEVSGTSMTNCPDFNSRPSTTDLNFSLVIKVVDSLTREPIPNAAVYLIDRGELVGSYTTNQKGIVLKNLPLGYYFITAEKTPYASNYFEGYVNANRNYVEIELGQSTPAYPEDQELMVTNDNDVGDPEINDPPVDDSETEIIIYDTDPELNEDENDSSDTTNDYNNTPPSDYTTPVDPDPVIIPPLAEIPDTLLDPTYFKYSNITFILDASSSMNAYGKMELLKMSMIELVKILRAEDNITVLKYAAEVNVILDHTSGDMKEEIVSSIKGIKTSGSTAGGDAINAAYAMNREKYIEGGNNLVIMITDGLFNKGATNYDETIASNFAKYGTRFTVVGIKTTDFVAEHMQAIVNKGGGQFIEIQSVYDAQTKLISEIRRTAYKGTN